VYNYDPNSAEYRDAYRRAEQRVRAKIGFYWHLTSYILVNGMLIAIYLLTTLAVGNLYYPWFVWPMFGWGIGLLFHFMGVFVFGGSRSEDARRRMIEEELRRMGVAGPGSQTPPERR
jgi:hypothetical protein